MLSEGGIMPTNRELDLERMKKLDDIMKKLDKILTLLENKIEPRKKGAGKTSKSS